MSAATLLLAMITNGAIFMVSHDTLNGHYKNPYNPALAHLCSLTNLSDYSLLAIDETDEADGGYQVTLHMTDGAKIPLAANSIMTTRCIEPADTDYIPGYFSHLSVITEATALATPHLKHKKLLRISYPVTQVASFSIALI